MHVTAITIFPMNPRTGWGCKTCEVSVDLNAQGLYSSVNSIICMNASGFDFIKCVEEEVYYNDVIINSTDPASFNATPFYTSDFMGYVLHSIDVKPCVMTHNLRSTLFIELNQNLSYLIVFTDPKLKFLTASSAPFPRSFLTFEKAGHVQAYLQVT